MEQEGSGAESEPPSTMPASTMPASSTLASTTLAADIAAEGTLAAAAPKVERMPVRRTPVDLGQPADHDVAVRLGRAWRELRRGGSSTVIRDYFFGVGPDALEYAQMDTLDVLIREPSWRMSDLALALHVDPSTATRAVQRLAGTGFVERLTDREDGRVVIVRITEAGRDLHRQLDLRRGYVLSRLMSVFTVQERATLAELMSRFVNELDEVVKDLPRLTIAE